MSSAHNHAHHDSDHCGCSRRDLLSRTLGCGGFLALSLAGLGAGAGRALAAPVTGKVVATQPWARIEKLGDDIWAVVSTPFDDKNNPQRQTLANGGIIAGWDAVMVVEGFNDPAGSAWVAQMARDLTGRWPTHVVVTHFHSDHVGGLAGFQRGAEGPDVIATGITRDLALDRYAKAPVPAKDDAAPGLASMQLKLVTPNRIIADAAKPVTIDLGGRTVRLVPRAGHTASDVTVEVDKPRVVFTGDFVFNRMFPFYGDSTPSLWNATCEAILKDPETLYVPGHGPLATAGDLIPYRQLLALVGEAATEAHRAGKPAEVAAGEFKIPERLGDWYLFNPRIFNFAFDAWYREMGARKG